MKKQLILLSVMLSLGAAGFSQSVADAVRAFDAVVLNSSGTRADTAVGFINYGDTGTCGSVAPWIQAEIKKAAAATRRISVVESATAVPEAKTVVATRGAYGPLSSAKKTGARSFVLSGTYYENGENLELFLSLYTDDGRLFASETALIPLSEIRRRKLTLYPENLERAQQIDEDFASAESEQLQESPLSVSAPSKSAKADEGAAKKSSFLITAAMLDEHNNLVDILHPNDTVRFMISTQKDSYIALLCIDANGDKNWLPVRDNFMRAGEVKVFPDIAGQVYKVVDGVYGAEQILVYASTAPAGLPAQDSGGTYNRGDIQHISRGIMAVKQQSAEQYETNVYKITYTVMN